MAQPELFVSDVHRGRHLDGGPVLVGEAGSEASGLGLRAARAFTSGEVVFRQRPAVFYQSAWSERAAPVCLHCGVALGGSLRELLGRVRVACGAEDEELRVMERCGLLDDVKLGLPTPLLCECGATFCSEECKAVQLAAGHHRLTCDNDAWAHFREHAELSHDTFALAGLLAAQVACEVLHGSSSTEAVAARYLQFAATPWHELTGSAEWVDRRRTMLDHSRQLLASALSGPLEASGFGELLTFTGYARLVGMLEVTTKDLSRVSPLDAPLRAALDWAPPQARMELATLGLAWMQLRSEAQDKQAQTSPELSEDEDAGAMDDGTLNLVEVSRRAASLPLLPGFDGFGLVEAVALTNHSCRANLDVDPTPDGPLEVVATAVRDVAEGDELLMSYIDDEQPRAQRQRQLHGGYGFRCCCVRCVAEGDG